MTPDKPTIRVVAAIVARDGRFLVTKRPPGGHMAGYWEFPGGKIEEHENPNQALARELEEELDVKIGTVTPFTRIEHDYPERHVVLDFLQTAIVSGVPRPVEVAALAWLSPGEMRDIDLLPADLPLIEKLEALCDEVTDV